MNKINKVLWNKFDDKKYVNVEQYIKRWHEDDEYDGYGNFIRPENFHIEYQKETSNIDLMKTLGNIDEETILKMAIELGIETPKTIPAIVEIKEILARDYTDVERTFQKAYKNLENGYGVWFPNIASRVGDKYFSSDEYWGWVNILSDAGDTVTQIDNPEYTYSGTGEPDKNKCFIFARFERNKRYSFIGLFGPARREGNKTIRTRIGEIVDIKNMKILQ